MQYIHQRANTARVHETSLPLGEVGQGGVFMLGVRVREERGARGGGGGRLSKIGIGSTSSCHCDQETCAARSAEDCYKSRKPLSVSCRGAASSFRVCELTVQDDCPGQILRDAGGMGRGPPAGAAIQHDQQVPVPHPEVVRVPWLHGSAHRARPPQGDRGGRVLFAASRLIDAEIGRSPCRRVPWRSVPTALDLWV